MILIIFLLFVTLPAVSYAEGNWDINHYDDYSIAATMDRDGDGMLGQICYFESEACLYAYFHETTCQAGSNNYPVLVNTDRAATYFSLACGMRIDVGRGGNVMLFPGFDEIDFLVREASWFSIVVPMEGDRFKVSRFSLMGSGAAVEKMRREFQVVHRRKKEFKKSENKDANYL